MGDNLLPALRLLVDNLPGAAAMIRRADMRVMVSGGAAAARYGFEGLEGRCLPDVVAPGRLSKLLSIYERVWAGEAQQFEHAMPEVGATYDVTLRPVRVEGAILYALMNARDITGQVDATVGQIAAEIERNQGLRALVRDMASPPSPADVDALRAALVSARVMANASGPEADYSHARVLVPARPQMLAAIRAVLATPARVYVLRPGLAAGGSGSAREAELSRARAQKNRPGS